MTTVSDYTALLSGKDFWLGLKPSGPVFITYSFETEPQYYLSGYYNVDFLFSFEPFTTLEKGLSRDAFEQWDLASGITFLEVSDSQGDIRLAKYDLTLGGSTSGTLAFAYYPSDEDPGSAVEESDIGGDIFVSVDWGAAVSQSLFFDTMRHEIGHTIGLKHPFDDDPVLEDNLDVQTNTIMSYTEPSGPELGFLDIDAVEFLYGLDSQDGSQAASWSWDSLNAILTQTGFSGADIIRGGARRPAPARRVVSPSRPLLGCARRRRQSHHRPGRPFCTRRSGQLYRRGTRAWVGRRHPGTAAQRELALQ